MYVYIYFYLASDQHNNNAFIPICFPFKEHPSEFALLSGSSGNVGGPADRFGKATGQLTFDKCAFGFRYRTGLLTKDGSSQLNISHTFYT